MQVPAAGHDALLLLLHLPAQVVLRPSQSQQLCPQLLALSQLFAVGLGQRLVVLPQRRVLLRQASVVIRLQASRGGLEVPQQLVPLRLQLCYCAVLI